MERFPPRERGQLDGEQQELHDELVASATKMFGESGELFTFLAPSGALVGPFAPLLYQPPEVGRNFLSFVRAIGTIPNLPPAAREVAILTVGAHFSGKYELYSHVRIASKYLDKEEIRALRNGERPTQNSSDANEQLQIAWEVANTSLKKPGPLEQKHWDDAVRVFGRDGASALVHYVAIYSFVCIFLNGFDVPVPEGEEI